MTGAITDTVTLTDTENYTNTAVWAGYVQHNGQLKCVGGRWNLKPATVFNIPRADGSRAPSSYDRWWLDMSTPMMDVEQTITDGSPYHWVASGKGMPVQFGSADLTFVTMCPFAGDVNAFPVHVRNKAKQKFRLALKDTKYQLGPMLAEARETAVGTAQLLTACVEIVASIATKVRQEKRAVAHFLLYGNWGKYAKKRPPRDLAKLGEEVRNAYLGVTFGIRPLISDIQKSAEGFSFLAENGALPWMRLKKGASESYETETQFGHAMSPWSGRLFTLRFQHMAACHYSCMYAMHRTSNTLYNDLQLDPSAIWEAIPYSWLVDYGLQVGDWLNSQFLDESGFSFMEGSESLVVKSNLSEQVEFPEPYDAGTKVSPRASRHWKIIGGRFKRTVLSETPGRPTFPQMKNRLGLTQLANALSVLSQLVGKA